jgi:hypothetical protein
MYVCMIARKMYVNIYIYLYSDAGKMEKCFRGYSADKDGICRILGCLSRWECVKLKEAYDRGGYKRTLEVMHVHMCVYICMCVYEYIYPYAFIYEVERGVYVYIEIFTFFGIYIHIRWRLNLP